MFALLWGPTVAAVSVILDHSDDITVTRQALDGLLLCARIASAHCIDEVAPFSETCFPIHFTFISSSSGYKAETLSKKP